MFPKRRAIDVSSDAERPVSISIGIPIKAEPASNVAMSRPRSSGCSRSQLP
jgi:hypothetical protein